MTERMLNALGVETCADLFKERALIYLLFSPVSVQSFLCICLGIGSAKVHRYGSYLCLRAGSMIFLHVCVCFYCSEYERKSISTERYLSFSDRHKKNHQNFQ